MSSSKLSDETPVPLARTVAFSHFSKRQVRSGNSGCLHGNKYNEQFLFNPVNQSLMHTARIFLRGRGSEGRPLFSPKVFQGIFWHFPPRMGTLTNIAVWLPVCNQSLSPLSVWSPAVNLPHLQLLYLPFLNADSSNLYRIGNLIRHYLTDAIIHLSGTSTSANKNTRHLTRKCQSSEFTSAFI